MKFVGEIGIPRREYLYELDYLDMVQIERGYERRHRHAWSIGRWETFHLMAAFCGGKNLQESGIHTPLDLIRFPWDYTSHKGGDDESDMPTPAVVEELRRKMREENERNGFK